MRSVVCLALTVLAAAGCQKNASTPRGTEVISWSSARATRRSVRAAKEVGPRVARDVILHARPERKGALKLALHVETAPVELSEGDKTIRRTAPLAVRATVEQNPDWTIRASCGEGPNHRLPTIVEGSPVTPEEMILMCSVNMKYQDSFNDLVYSMAIEVGGDGAIRPALQGGKVSLE